MAVQLARRDPGRDPPADAVGRVRPQPTACRPVGLLIPEDVLRDTEPLNVIDRILGGAGRPGAAPTEVDSWVALPRLRTAASGEQLVERVNAAWQTID